MPVSPKTVAFVLCLLAGLYLIFTGSLIIGLILVGLAIVIPAA